MEFEIDNYNALHAALDQMCLGFEKERIPDGTVFDCKLVAAELLSNVLQHGGERAYFRALISGDEIVISVRSENEFRPPEKSQCAGVTQECGRGLFLVDSVCFRREYNEREGIRVTLKIIK